MTVKRKRPRRRIGLFIAGGGYAYQHQLFLGAHDECVRRDHDLVSLAGGSLGWNDPRNSVYWLPSPEQFDAAILVPGTWGAPLDSQPVQSLIERYASLPCAVVGCRVPGRISLWIDNAAGIASLTNHLLEEHGCRRIAFICGGGPEGRERLEAFQSAMRRRGLEVEPSLILPGDFTLEAGRAAAAQLCANGPPPCDALIAANDWMAFGAIDELQRRNVKVPDDVRVVGFDDVDQARLVTPSLTTVRQLPHELGVRAVRALAEQLAGETTSVGHSVPTQLQLRRSCGCFGLKNAVADRPPPSRSSWDSEKLVKAWTRELLTHDFSLAEDLREGWARNLAAALMGDLQHQTQGAFVGTLEGLVAEGMGRADVSDWYGILARLRLACCDFAAQTPDRLLCYEQLFQAAQSHVAENVELAFGRERLDREDIERRLGELNRHARTALDWNAMCTVLAEHLPGLDVPSCYIAETVRSDAASSRQVFAFSDQEQKALTASEFPTAEIVPAQLLPKRRHTLLVHALFMHQESFGFACFELNTRDPSVFKTLEGVISSGLKAAQLSAALVREVETRERAEQERMQQELTIASRIQSAILPQSPKAPGLEIAALMIPATEVGGDYYDILPCEDGCWLGIGDVAGHGLPAGLVMLMIQSIVSATVRGRGDIEPGIAWKTLNAVLTENIRMRLGQSEHATLCLLRYFETGRVLLSGGHEDILIYRHASGRCESLRPPGVWAGVFPHAGGDRPAQAELQLQAGDLMLLYTDGVLECSNAEGERFERERLIAALERHSHLPVEQVRDALRDEVQAWMCRQDDDLTLVVVRHCGRQRGEHAALEGHAMERSRGMS